MEYHSTAGRPMAVIDCVEQKQYINSFCVTSRGTWIVSVTSGHSGRAKVYTRRSEDRGRTWSSERSVAFDAKIRFGDDYDAEMGQLVPVTGLPGVEGERVYQFHIVRNIRKGARFGKIVYTISEDDGRTWRGPGKAGSVYELEAPVYELVGHEWGWHLMAPPRRMRNGELCLPLNVCTDPPSLRDIRSELVFARSENIYTESDPARIEFSFHPEPPRGVPVPLDWAPGESQGMEPQVAELPDGRVFAVIRTGNGNVAFVVSADDGRTWSEPKVLRREEGGAPILNPNCPCPLTTLSDGRLVLLHCNNDGSVDGVNDVYRADVVRHPIYVSVGLPK